MKKRLPELLKIGNKMYIPLQLLIVYILFTFLIHAIGPWDFYEHDASSKFRVFMFLLFFLVCSTFAYFKGMEKSNKVDVDSTTKKVSNNHNEFRLLKYSLLISILIYSLLIIEGFYLYDITFSDLLNLKETIAWAYFRSHNTVTTRGIPLTLYIIGYFFCNYALTIGLYRFSNVKISMKIGIVSVFFLAVTYNALIIGSNKAFGDIIIIIVSISMLKYAKKGIRLGKRNILVLAAITIALVILFGNSFSERFLLWGDIDTLFEGMRVLNLDNWMIKYLPKGLAIGVALAIYYVSHGYYGLALTLKLPFVWTKGLGSSFAISKVATKLFNLDGSINALTYPSRMEAATGWSAYSNWHTIFPWLASDFTFIGSILILSGVIYIYAIAWKESINDEHWSSLLMFAFLNQLILFIPANNQIFQTTTMTIAFLLISVCWFNRNGYFTKIVKKNLQKVEEMLHHE